MGGNTRIQILSNFFENLSQSSLIMILTGSNIAQGQSAVSRLDYDNTLTDSYEAYQLDSYLG